DDGLLPGRVRPLLRSPRGLALETQRRSSGLRLRRADLALRAARVHLFELGIGTTALDEVGAMQFAVLEIDEQTVGVAEVAVAAGGQSRTDRQRRRIHL